MTDGEVDWYQIVNAETLQMVRARNAEELRQANPQVIDNEVIFQGKVYASG